VAIKINEVPLDPEIKKSQDAWAAGEYDRKLEEVKFLRHSAYIAPGGSDAVFMKWQRGEATEQQWLDAKQAIDDLYPYPKK
jgi:hypothetical protein